MITSVIAGNSFHSLNLKVHRLFLWSAIFEENSGSTHEKKRY